MYVYKTTSGMMPLTRLGIRESSRSLNIEVSPEKELTKIKTNGEKNVIGVNQ